MKQIRLTRSREQNIWYLNLHCRLAPHIHVVIKKERYYVSLFGIGLELEKLPF